jgi:hypothetical protein
MVLMLSGLPNNVGLEWTPLPQCQSITHHKAILLSKTNLLEIGLGHLAGGANVTDVPAQTLHDLNHMHTTTANIFKLEELAKKSATGSMNHNLQASAVMPE